MSPAMAAGVSDRLWEIGDIVKLVESAEADVAPKVRGPYFKLTHYQKPCSLVRNVIVLARSRTVSGSPRTWWSQQFRYKTWLKV
jgi:hypothetical protein